jgi:hypothetical protein
VNWKGKRVLITGGTSFIGSSFADTLVSRGGIVRVVDYLSTGRYEYISHMVESGTVGSHATRNTRRSCLLIWSSSTYSAPKGGAQTDVVPSWCQEGL